MFAFKLDVFYLNIELKPRPCDSVPCKNGGICSNVGGSFSCECVGSFVGKTCEGVYISSITCAPRL